MKQKHILLVVTLSVAALIVAGIFLLVREQQQLKAVYTPNLQPSSSASEEKTPEEPPQEEQSAQQENGDAALEGETPSGEVVEPSEVEVQESVQQEQPEPEPELTAEEQAQQSLDEALDALYEAQDRYMASLEQLSGAVEAEFNDLPAEEQTKRNKLALVEARMDEISAMEKSCDTEVEDILMVIAKAQLVLGDTDMVNEIRSYYSDMKATVKADYLTALSYS